MTPILKVPLAILIVFLIYVVSLCTRNGLADLYAEPAEIFLQSKRDAGERLTVEEWRAIDNNLRRSLSLAPGDPTTLTELGRIHRIQLEYDDLDQAAVEHYGGLAINYYEQAAALRPTWPWGWSALALVRFELYQDALDEYHQTLIRAAHFGPWDAAVQRIIVDLGLDSWASLSEEAKWAVLGSVDRALLRQPDGLNSIVNSEQAWLTLCMSSISRTEGQPVADETDEFVRLRRHCDALGEESVETL